jgi:hypothetical protein
MVVHALACRGDGAAHIGREEGSDEEDVCGLVSSWRMSADRFRVGLGLAVTKSCSV